MARIRLLCIALPLLLLGSGAPPRPVVYLPAHIAAAPAVPAVVRPIAHAPAVVERPGLDLAAFAQACSYASAPNRFSTTIFDGRGYPFGEVAAWSCTSADAALAEYTARRDAMQAAADQIRP